MISASHVEQTRYWLDRFRQLQRMSVPMRIHSRAIAPDGAPEWSAQMAAYMGGELPLKPWQQDSDQRRLKRALKRIRERSLREYEVLHRAMDGDQTVDEITAWLNERAIRGGHPERYTPTMTTVILFAAVDKLEAWW